MITVLRLGHRPGRDKRITTHVALVARAFGADRVLISAEDSAIEETVRSMVVRFGGDFRIESGIAWRKVLKGWKGVSVHLTMYGERMDDVIPQLPPDKDLLVVVGAEKVPREVYEETDFNVGVGNQPHSEVAALGVFLDRYLQGSAVSKDFDGEMCVVPTPRGKLVVPGTEACLRMLEEAGCEPGVVEHCQQVAELAVALAGLAGARVPLVRAGALLHDIGRSVTHDLGHIPEGERIAKQLGLADEVVSIIGRHVGSGVTAEEAETIGLPPKDYTPLTLEEKLVNHADSLIVGGKKVGIAELETRLQYLGLPQVARKARALHEELGAACGVDLDTL